MKHWCLDGPRRMVKGSEDRPSHPFVSALCPPSSLLAQDKHQPARLPKRVNRSRAVPRLASAARVRGRTSMTDHAEPEHKRTAGCSPGPGGCRCQSTGEGGGWRNKWWWRFEFDRALPLTTGMNLLLGLWHAERLALWAQHLVNGCSGWGLNRCSPLNVLANMRLTGISYFTEFSWAALEIITVDFLICDRQ